MLPLKYPRLAVSLTLVFAALVWAVFWWIDSDQPAGLTDPGKPIPFATKLEPAAEDDLPRAVLNRHEAGFARMVRESHEPELTVAAPGVSSTDVVRQRLVQFDSVPLKAALRALQAGETSEPVALDLFGDTALKMHVTRGKLTSESQFVLSGRIENDPHSQVVFSERDGFVFGNISSSVGTFSIEPTGVDGTHAISEKILLSGRVCGTGDSLENAVFGHERDFANHIPETQVHTSSVSALSLEDGPPPSAAAMTFEEKELITIDVMVLYTQAAKFRWTFNLESVMLAKIDAMVEQANDVFERSGTRARVRLVHAAEIELEETQDQDVNLNAVAGDEANQQLRNEHAADLVFVLFRNEPAANKDHAAGQLINANVEHVDFGGASAENDFYDIWSAAQYNNVLEWFNFVHGLGHCLGSTHERDADESVPVFDYSRGHKFEANGNPKLTIMATGPASQLVPYFSNPDLTYEDSGVAMGVPEGQENEADNHRSINQTAFEVSQYRLEKMAGGSGQRLINVSTRGFVGTESAQMIGGFVLSGSGPQDILIRAQGPNLTQFGLQGVLADPKIELFSGPDKLFENDDWQENPSDMVAAITASGFQPEDSKEPALHVSLNPGAYTCVLSGLGNLPTGVGIVEVFGLDSDEPRVVNLSTRGQAESGDNSMIAGIVIEGSPNETRRVLVRVLGPTLTGFGVEGAMPDPHLKLFDANGNLLYVNEDFDFNSSYAQTAVTATGFAPPNSVEPAIIVDLKPGPYTVVVTPFANEENPAVSGVGLVEAYEILE